MQHRRSTQSIAYIWTYVCQCSVSFLFPNIHRARAEPRSAAPHACTNCNSSSRQSDERSNIKQKPCGRNMCAVSRMTTARPWPAVVCATKRDGSSLGQQHQQKTNVKLIEMRQQIKRTACLMRDGQREKE